MYKNCSTCKYGYPFSLFEPFAICSTQNDAIVKFPVGKEALESPCELWKGGNYDTIHRRTDTR